MSKDRAIMGKNSRGVLAGIAVGLSIGAVMLSGPATSAAEKIPLRLELVAGGRALRLLRGQAIGL